MPDFKNNSTLFASVAPYNQVKGLAHGLKRGDESSIRKAAEVMAGVVSALGENRRCILVPIPGHEGHATYTLELCRQIGAITGMETADLLQGKHHIPLYQAKRNDMKPEGIRIEYTLRKDMPKGVTPIIVDNVLDTGHTSWAAVRALGTPDTRLAVLGHTSRYLANKEVSFTQINLENMEKKQVEVKQVKAAQVGQESKPEKKTAKQKTKAAVSTAKESKNKESPLVKQYNDLKKKHPDAVLLFRSGDFYKAVGDDAKKVADTVGVAAIKDKKEGAVVASFPYHHLDTYLPKLIRAGMRVAIADQLEKPEAKKLEAAKPKEEAKSEKKEKTEQKSPRAPQLVTVNGEKVTHAHAFQSTKNQDVWYFTARLDGKQLRPMMMKPKDVEAYQKKDTTVEHLMKTYYPSKMEKKITAEQYKSDMTLSDGRKIDKMNVFKEKDESREDFGKYKLFAQVGDKKMAVVMSAGDLNSFFDRTTTPAKLVEKNFGERLNLASAYEKYRLPESPKISDIRVAKDKDGEWKVSAKVGEEGRTPKVSITKTDRYSFFEAHTVTREQLAAKYLQAGILNVMANKQEQKVGMKL